MIPEACMSHRSNSSLGLFVLAGVGAGAFTGVLLGLLATRHPRGGAVGEMRDFAGDLKRRAERVLSDLSRAGPGAPHPPDR